MTSLLIFSEKTSSRLEYVCRLVLTSNMGLSYSITTDKQAFETYQGPKITYGPLPGKPYLSIPATGLLFETGAKQQEINTTLFNGLTVPFAAEGGSLPFDLFAAVFYLVTRYEEYLPFERNQYGQFKATGSLAYKLGFLNKPVVDIWIASLAAALKKQYPLLQLKQNHFCSTFTYDIDVAYAYRGRSFFTTAAKIIKQFFLLQFAGMRRRLRVLLGTAPDPFDTYEAIIKQQKSTGHATLFFFLLGPKNKYNRNLNPYKKELQQLVHHIAATEKTGIHPSYYAHNDFLQLQHEKLLLESIINKKIVCSRQHYLRLVFPNTYRNLVKAGITDDYTLGFAELPGFRAGTCTAFPFYDLLADEVTPLIIHPNTFMEGTFIEDMKLKPEAALPLMQQLVDEVKKVNGHFISIWHNHSLSDQDEWKGLKAVHDAIAAYAAAG